MNGDLKSESRPENDSLDSENKLKEAQKNTCSIYEELNKQLSVLIGMRDNVKAESLLLSEDLAKNMQPTIKKISDEVNGIVAPVTKALRNELKEATRRADSITSDLSKQLSILRKLNQSAEKSIGAAAAQVSEVHSEYAELIKTELDRQLKPLAHGLVNDVRQATEEEREKLKQSLEDVTSQAENAIFMLNMNSNVGTLKKSLRNLLPIMLTVSFTLLTIMGYQSLSNPITNLSSEDQKTYATGKMFERVWPNLSDKQKNEYRNLAADLNVN